MEFWRRKKKARKCFLKSGSMFLQQLIADCNGMSNPIRMFSSDQMSKATDHFDPMSALPNSFWFTLYKGVIEGRSYVIKRFSEYVVRAEEANVYNDIALSARVSNHSGFLKLIGCCLEFPRPIMVFEDLEYIAVNERGSLGSEDGPLLPWNVRLKIAKEIATAITYLHSAFPRIIIHRDICAKNVFLDKNGTAKLTDLTVAVTLPEGKSWIEDRVTGIIGYIDPIYARTGIVTEYSDVYNVYSFGILMLILLMGKPSLLDDSDGHLVFDTNILVHVKDLQQRGEPVEFGGDSN
ncbi:PREDICTED: non-functional pseudokinase ZED1-like [Brassica oleracea var. oleracea]|uniref:non-functional pseudokinase ZED1-like n=1 Tax=Brassica oleracea var. oleracea TaxID=109376 RepID=UPI0006A702E9|nr:PREDICTED: non-functional pseudokinase ZED1-like [Brassica oleracea var. oleracea]